MTSYPSRIGSFFLIVGVALLVLYVISLFNHQPENRLLLPGAIGVLIGFLLRKGKRNKVESGRFRVLRTLSRKNRQAQENEEDQEQDP